MPNTPIPAETTTPAPTRDEADAEPCVHERAVEVGGRDGPEPTRYGDWEKDGRCIDF
ncbi:MAG: DUF1674 domain-containing protein [Dokdonella sp.]